MNELDFGYIFGLSIERAEVWSESVFVMSTNSKCLVFLLAPQTNSLGFSIVGGENSAFHLSADKNLDLNET